MQRLFWTTISATSNNKRLIADGWRMAVLESIGVSQPLAVAPLYLTLLATPKVVEAHVRRGTIPYGWSLPRSYVRGTLGIQG